MDDLNLGSDESIQKKIPKIIVAGTRSEAILTSRRILLAERETGRVFWECQYTDITLVISGVNSIHEPVLTITSTRPDKEQESVELVFVYQSAGQNIRDLEKCITALKEQNVPFQNTGLLSATTPMSRVSAVSASLQVDEEPKDERTASDRTLTGNYRKLKQLPPENSQEKSYFTTVAIVLVVIAVLIVGAFIAGQVLKNKNAPVPVVTPAPTAVTTAEPVPAETTAEVQLTPTPSATPANTTGEMSIPVNGIWAKITYPGNYSGSLGAQGRMYAVNNSGTRFVPLPFHDATIDGTVEKGDGSADMLEIAIYNGGSLVSAINTTRPFGTIDVHVPVGPAQWNGLVVTPTPEAVVVIPTPETSLALRTVPSTGVWVRVAYPGTFAGSIGSNGNWRQVESSGDQFYQIPMKDGLVEGTLEKSDNSTMNMVVQVYKDGTLVSYGNTTRPKGNVEFHKTV
ncbi:hypothetical protein [Methanoregula sp.]|uniref:hypothetical protein n=1 Tax=Methanoregula sp. TaxID=2052170 RepID=UPI003569C8AA